jgi:hypothetical protein
MALVIQLKESLEDLAAGRRRDCESNALGGVVEAVIKADVVPPIGLGHGTVDLGVDLAESCDVRVAKFVAMDLAI